MNAEVVCASRSVDHSAGTRLFVHPFFRMLASHWAQEKAPF